MLLAIAVSVSGATWHVAKDGTGDFSVIQDAVEAASPGDTIWIHAGRYEEIVEDFDVWGNDTVRANVHVAVTKDNLTFKGDGPELTIIGPETQPDDQPANYMGISATNSYASGVTVSDLAIESAYYGMYLACTSATVSGSRFEGTDEGVRVQASGSCAFDNCDFIEAGESIGAYSPACNLRITNSRFTNCWTAGTYVTTENVVLEDCAVVGAHTPFNFQQGTSAVLRRVEVRDYVTTGVYVASGSSAEVFNCIFEGGMNGVGSNGESFVCVGTAFLGQSNRTVTINNGGDARFESCSFINGGGLSVYCWYNGSQDCRVDMTNCYWGTDSEEQIAEWIHDSNDEPEFCCVVDFIPFQTGTPVESRSWSSVKGLFKGGGEE